MAKTASTSVAFTFVPSPAPRCWLVPSATRMTVAADGTRSPETVSCVAMRQTAASDPQQWADGVVTVEELLDNGQTMGGDYTQGEEVTPDAATVAVTFRLESPSGEPLDTATVAVVREHAGEAGTAFSVEGAQVMLREGKASTAVVRITAVKGSQTLTLDTLGALKTDASGNAVYDLGGGLKWLFAAGLGGYGFAYDGSGKPQTQSLQFKVTASDGSQFSGTIRVETVAAAYSLRPSASLVRRSGMTGACTPAKLTCEAVVSWGDMTASADGFAIRYKPASQGVPLFVSALPSTGVTVGDSWDSVDFELYRSASDFGTPLATVTVPVVTDGAQGAQGIAGPAYRTSLWAADTDYLNQLNENVNPRTVDIAFIPDSSSQARYRAFLCKQSHRSSAANRPGTAGAPWEEFQGMPPVYTPLLLAENAVITLLQTNAIRVTGSSGGTAAGVAGGEWMFWGGAEAPSDAPYRVGADGSLYATKADIRGTVNAQRGRFGNIVISGSEMFAESPDGQKVMRFLSALPDPASLFAEEAATITGASTSTAGAYATYGGMYGSVSTAEDTGGVFAIARFTFKLPEGTTRLRVGRPFADLEWQRNPSDTSHSWLTRTVSLQRKSGGAWLSLGTQDIGSQGDDIVFENALSKGDELSLLVQARASWDGDTRYAVLEAGFEGGIWARVAGIDKGLYVTPGGIASIRSSTNYMIHTDTSFKVSVNGVGFEIDSSGFKKTGWS